MTDTKDCTRCGQTRLRGDFTKGSSYCRPCQKARYQAYYAANRDRLIAQARGRNVRNAERLAPKIKAWKEANRDEQRRLAQERRRLNPDAVRAYSSAYKRAFPERNRALAAVAKAVKQGKLIPTPCEVCGAERTQAHHASYAPDMKLAVVWLCPPHHRQVHAMRLSC